MTTQSIFSLVTLAFQTAVIITVVVIIQTRTGWLKKKRIFEKAIQEKNFKLQFAYDIALTSLFIINVFSCSIDVYYSMSGIALFFLFLNPLVLAFMIHTGVLRYRSHLRKKAFDFAAKNYSIMIGLLFKKIPRHVDLTKIKGDPRNTYCNDCGRTMMFDYGGYELFMNEVTEEQRLETHIRLVCDDCYHGNKHHPYNQLTENSKRVDRSTYIPK